MTPSQAYDGAPGLRVELDGAVLRLTLDRADKRNAIDEAMMVGLVRAVGAAEEDERVRAVVLTGEATTSAGAPTSSPATRATSAPGPAASSAGCRTRPTA